MKRILASALATLLLWCFFILGVPPSALPFGIEAAQAQSPVITWPQPKTSINASSTITATNTFQSVFASSGGGATNGGGGSPGRQGCTIQNTGSHNQFVFFGPITSALTPTSVQLGAGQSVTCSVNGIILQDQVSITGTAQDTFFAAQQ